MKNRILMGMIFGAFLMYSNAYAQSVSQMDCNPTAKFFCSCEHMTHGAYYQISYVKLDLKTGQRSIVTALKPYNLPPVFERHEGSAGDDLNDCRVLMSTYSECQ